MPAQARRRGRRSVEKPRAPDERCALAVLEPSPPALTGGGALGGSGTRPRPTSGGAPLAARSAMAACTEDTEAPALKRQRGSPRGGEEDALQLILAEMRCISRRVAALEGEPPRREVPPPPTPRVDAPGPSGSSPHGGRFAPPPPSPMGVEDVDGMLDVHAGDSSDDSLYSPKEPSPFDIDEGEEEAPLPRGNLDVVLEAARDLGLQTLDARTPPPPRDVWASAAAPPSPPSFPVAQGFLEMLRKHWPAGPPTKGGKKGCAGMRGVCYAPGSGLNWMPPVEQEVAMLTSLPLGSVSNDSSHPTTDGRVLDRQIATAFNAAMRAARAGNVLAILLAAAGQQVGDDNARLSEMLSAALSVQSYVTTDVGDCLGQLVRSRRHLWLAETSLPPAMRAQLVALPVEPGRVFHSSTRAALEQAGEARRTKEKICAAFRKTGARPSAARSQDARPDWARGEPSRYFPQSGPPPSLPSREGEGARSFRGRRTARGAQRRSGGPGKRGSAPQ